MPRGLSLGVAGVAQVEESGGRLSSGAVVVQVQKTFPVGDELRLEAFEPLNVTSNRFCEPADVPLREGIRYEERQDRSGD